MNQRVLLRWVLGAGLLSAGCEVSVGNCDKDDAGECIDLVPEFDASSALDAGDSAVAPGDARLPDSSTPPDATTLADGGLDASAPDAATTVLTEQQFCEAQFATSRAWRDQFSTQCGCLSNDDVAGAASFLAAALNFNDQTISGCPDRIQQLRGLGVQFDGSKAAACARAFSANFQDPSAFTAPLASCSAGFDIGKLEAEVGHGRQAVAQLADCRATFVGTKARDAACTDSLECAGGLRCRGIPGGGGTTCQPALAKSEVCSKNDECADGLICSLNVPGNGTTVAAQSVCLGTGALELKSLNGNCARSFECERGLVCDVDSHKCVPAVSDVICGG